jgi:hypothetical protein
MKKAPFWCFECVLPKEFIQSLILNLVKASQGLVNV